MSTASSFVSIEAIEVSCYDRDRYGQRQNAGDSACRPDQLAPVTDRNLISVPDRRHGNNRPPERVRNAVDLRVGLTELGVVDGAGKHQQADAQGDQEESESFEAGPERQQQYLKSDGMFRQFENADQPDDAQEGQRCARLGALAAHCRQNVEQRYVVGQNRDDVHDVLEVSPERQLRRARDESNDRLDGEPGRARRLDKEKHVDGPGLFFFRLLRLNRKPVLSLFQKEIH